MQNFLEKWDKLSEKTQKIYEIIAGAVLGAVSGAFLFLSGSEGSSYLTIILAIGIPLLVPNMLEKKSGRQFGMLRIAMLVVLFLIVAITLIYGLVSGEFKV